MYFSLGTNVSPSMLSSEKVQAIANGLAKLKYDVLIKWDSNELPGKGSNTRVVQWLPQSDLLRKYIHTIKYNNRYIPNDVIDEYRHLTF